MMGKVSLIFAWFNLGIALTDINEGFKTISLILACIASCFTIYYFRKKIKHDFKEGNNSDDK